MKPLGEFDLLSVGRRVLEVEGKAVLDVGSRLDSSFVDALRLLVGIRGRIIVCGMGKSGIVGKKIAATLASTGSPSFFLHPGEAYHGDLGMVTASDACLLLSNSGETDEVVKLLPYFSALGVPVVSITSNGRSTLAKASEAHITVAVEKEACPLNLAPTASTTAVMAVGDALAVSLMEAKGFESEDFARYHPGGELGRLLLSLVDDVMRPIGDFPSVLEGADVLQVIKEMSEFRCSACLVGGIGVITDGDLRRAIAAYPHGLLSMSASQLMTREPVSVASGTRTEDALVLMEKEEITSLLVTKSGDIVGLVVK